MNTPAPRWRLWMVLACWVILTPAQAEGQAERIQALEQRLQESMALIDALAARVAELERRGNASASGPKPAVAAPAPSEEAARSVASLQDDVRQISNGLSQRSGSGGLKLHGFADVGAAASSRADPDRVRGFNAGTLDLYMTPQFGDRVKSLIELAFEHTQHEGSIVELERLQIGYTASNDLTLWAGRFHTPFGWWNTAYHHGAQLQPSISRPRFLEFEDKGGILPVHSVGVWASGRQRLDSGRVHYETYLGNGARIEEGLLRVNAQGDGDANRMLGATLGYEPAGSLQGLMLGVHGFGLSVNTFAGDGSVLRKTRLRMLGGHFVYESDGWEAIGEYYGFANADARGDARHSSRVWFVQGGRSIGQWAAYGRLERSALDADDMYFASQRAGRSYRRVVVGARYALSPSAAVKFELSSTHEPATTQIDVNGAPVPFDAARYRRAAVQYSIAF